MTEQQFAETVEVLHARIDAMGGSLADLVRYIRRLNGFMTHEDQELLHVAESLLASELRR